jgi:hypothetical protein
MISRYFHILLLSLIFLNSGCFPVRNQPAFSEWTLSELRAVDNVDSLNQTMDLIALYIRTNNPIIQIRLDFLDHSDIVDYDLYLAFDSQTGGTTEMPINSTTSFEWDTLISIPASGPITASSPGNLRLNNSGIHIIRDPVLDTAIITLNRSLLDGEQYAPWSNSNFNLQVFITPAGNTNPSDSLGPTNSNNLPPKPVPVLFAFWNSFAAYTPGQALRRWDGAHTGPMGGRHGLVNLLRTAASKNIPLFLLDLNTSFSLSALEYLGVLPHVKEMLDDGLLVLPESIPDSEYSPVPLPDWAIDRLLIENRQVAEDFGIPATTYLYAASDIKNPPNNSRIIFTKTVPFTTEKNTFELTSVIRKGNQSIIPIIDYNQYDNQSQATLDGLSLQLRKTLIDSAITINNSNRRESTELLILGGDLSESTWGVPKMARSSFHYINTHPWIKLVTSHNLKSISQSAHSSYPNPVELVDTPPDNAIDSGEIDELIAALQQVPDNPIGSAAWHAYQALFSPISPTSPDIQDVRANYLGDIWTLISAAEWVQAPKPYSSCETDVDHDGELECILASSTIFAVVEPIGGYLSALVIRSSTGTHQIIGPSSQLISGLSDSLFWNLDGGIQADPYVINGAFVDAGIQYKVLIEPGGLSLTSIDGVIKKTYKLTNSGLRIDYQLNATTIPLQAQIPLISDPWNRFSPGWSQRYSADETENRFVWHLSPDLKVLIESSNQISVSEFTESRDFLALPENPNRDYPAGHFLPFPLALVDIEFNNDFYVYIEVIPTE